MSSSSVPTHPARAAAPDPYRAEPHAWFLSLAARDLERVFRLPDGCWIYLGSIGRSGYGQIEHRWRSPEGKVRRITMQAHDAAYELAYGPIPPGKRVDHLCHNRDLNCRADKYGKGCLHRRCVRPSHLGAATARQNNLRGHHPNAIAHMNQTCTRGDPATDANTYIAPNGKRRCKGPLCRNAAKERKANRDAIARRTA
jgi:hypothetical protein